MNLGVKVIRVDAEKRFLDALRGENDPERNRKIIGAEFVKVFEEESNKLEGVDFPAQGTIYPDVIESTGSKTGKAHVNKRHHNVCGSPANMRLKLVDPLRELFKEEVRKLGVELGLPREMVYRHPFPVRVSASASSAKCARTTRTSRAKPITSSSKSCAGTICTTRHRRHSRCFCRCAR